MFLNFLDYVQIFSKFPEAETPACRQAGFLGIFLLVVAKERYIKCWIIVIIIDVLELIQE